jgi:superfamily II DNA/RNA helicase
MLFSATFPEYGMPWIDSVLKTTHAVIKNVRANAPNLRIVQTVEECPGNAKLIRMLEHCQQIIINHQEEHPDTFPRILVFVSQCVKSDAYAFFLNSHEIKASSLNR